MSFNKTGLLVAVLAVAFVAPSAFAQCERQKLTASDGAAGDQFGIWVALNAGTAIVGAFLDDDAGSSSGSAYVYRLDQGIWIEEQKLTPADLSASDRFGEGASVYGNVAAVAAHSQDGVGTQSGAVYVFRFDGSTWIGEQKLTASDGAAFDHYGESVSIIESVVVVGSHFDDAGGAGSGSAYVYRHNGLTWVEEQKLIASDAAPGDTFGNAVSVSGDIVVVGAHGNDDAGSGSGSAYVYRYNGLTWVEEQKLTAFDAATGDNFGERVSLSGDVAFIAARLDDDAGSNSGSVYVYRYNGVTWVEKQKLTASDADAGDQFGFSVSVSGDFGVVGSVNDGDAGIGSGSAYIFRFDGDSWVEKGKLTASDAAAGDRFGESVAVDGSDGGIAVVGANFDDDAGSSSGSAYVYALTAPGDFDCDGDVDLADFAEFVPCMTGPGGGLATPGCDVFDFEPDDDVDLEDFDGFQMAFTGAS